MKNLNSGWRTRTKHNSKAQPVGVVGLVVVATRESRLCRQLHETEQRIFRKFFGNSWPAKEALGAPCGCIRCYERDAEEIRENRVEHQKVEVMHRIVRVVLCRPINLGSVTAHLPRLPVSSVWKASRTDFRKRGVSHVMVHEYVSIELNEH